MTGSNLDTHPYPARYSGVAQALHWAIALLIVFEIGLGWRMDGPPGAVTFAVYQLHKSIGITILILTLVRVGWRITHRPPASVGGRAWEHRLAAVVHVGFYVLLLAIPLSGWLIVSASRTGIGTVLFGVIPFPHIPGVPGLDPAPKAALEQAAETAHRLLGWAMYGLLALHVAGALKHHVIDRDQGLIRMMPGRPHIRLVSARLIGLLAAIALIAGAATAYPWISARPAEPEAEATPLASTVTPDPASVVPTQTPAPAASETPAEAETTPPEDARPSRWTVRKGQSSLSFSTTQSGSPIRGGFSDWSADILFSPDALAASRVRVTVVMSSFTTQDGDSQGVLGGPQWFDTAAHARAVFSADRFRALGSDRYEARGTLSLKGVSRPAVLRFTLRIEGDTARLTGTTTLDRTAFGVGTGEWAGTDDIPAQVAVETRLVAVRADD